MLIICNEFDRCNISLVPRTLDCKLNFIIIPLLGDHVLREANCGEFKSGKLQRLPSSKLQPLHKSMSVSIKLQQLFKPTVPQQESAAASEELNSQAEILQNLVHQFKLKD